MTDDPDVLIGQLMERDNDVRVNRKVYGNDHPLVVAAEQAFQQQREKVRKALVAPQVEVLHVRDPDSSCSIAVWVNGVETRDFAEVDSDPGAGYMRSDWDEHTRSIEANEKLSEAFRAAAVAERDGTESQYIKEDET